MKLLPHVAPRYDLDVATSGGMHSPTSQASPAATIDDAPLAGVDLDGARVHLETRNGFGLVRAWYFAAKPRRAATIVPAAQTAFHGERPIGAVTSYAMQTVQRGVSVLIVDVRCEGLHSLLFGPRPDDAIRAGTDYLCDRGYAIDAIALAPREDLSTVFAASEP